MMKNMFIRLFVIALTLTIIGCSKTNEKASIRAIVTAGSELKLSSPDGKNVVQFRLEDGKPEYEVSRSGEDIITPSRMGFTFKGESASLVRFELVSADTSSA